MKKLRKNILREHLAELFQNLTHLDRAGVSLEEAVITLAQAPPHPYLKQPLHHILQGIRSGLLLSEEMAQHPEIFSPFMIQVVAVGEKTGTLAPYFHEISTYLHWQIHLSQTLYQALRYGGVLFSLIILMIFAVTSALLPQVKGLLLSLGIAELPLATRALLYVGDFDSVRIFFMLTVISVTLVALRYQPACLRHIPGYGPLLIAHNLIPFLKTLAALLQAHVDLLVALQQAQQTITFPYLRKALASVPTTIAAGATLSQALLAAQPYFPPMALRLIRLGESTGSLPALVAQAAMGCEHRYARSVERLVKRLHPTLVATLGLLILWIVLATLLPLYHHLDDALSQH